MFIPFNYLEIIFWRVRKIVKNDCYLYHASPFVCLSIRKEQRGSHWTDFHKIWYFEYFSKIYREIQVSLNWQEKRVFLHEDQYTFLITSRSALLRMRNVIHEGCKENQKTHFMFSNCFRKSCRWRYNVEKYSRATKATDDYDTCALHARFLRLQIHTQNM